MSGSTFTFDFPLETSGGNPGGSVTIPLEITIRLGAGSALSRSAAVETAPGASPAPVTAAGLSALSRSLAELARARSGEQPYYDEEADAQSRTEYYRSINQGLPPDDRFRALRDLLKRTHRTRLRYSPSTHLYPLVDLRPNGKILSIYSEQEFEPEDLIRADFEADRGRRAALQSMAAMESLQMEDLRARVDRLEAAFPYNCEHVVPQSWFSRREPMRGDLHHLFACEIRCNSFRENIPYFDFDDDRGIMADCGRSEKGKFEPVGGKGTVARGTLYFLLRYPGEINNNSREYTRDRIAVLLRWHKQFPVDLYERHRNAAIYKKQGTRNPLIDHPEWAGEIEFQLGLG